VYLIIDQGTSSTKSFIINDKGKIVFSNRIKHRLEYPKKNHVEFEPLEILYACNFLISEAVNYINKKDFISMGLSVQRSSFLFWDKKTIKPLTKGISWQDSRAKDIVNKLKENKNWIYKTTGLPLSAHFGGPKFVKMLLDNPFLKVQIKKGNVIYGPLSSFLTHALTKNIAIDHSIASRTLFFDNKKCDWVDDCLTLFDIPRKILPTIKPVYYNFGKILNYNFNLKCVIGDQQASLIGQNGFKKNSVGMNLGTSGSILYNAGNEQKFINGLISGILYSNKKTTLFLNEGTINACNSLFHHLEKKLNISHQNMQWNQRCKNMNTEGIYIAGFSGIAAPYWLSGFDDFYWNINKNNCDEIIRAGMESIGLLTNDIFQILKNNIPEKIKIITVSGGASKSSLMQFISDIIRRPIIRTKMKDKTAMGVYKILNKDYTDCIDKDKKYNPKTKKNKFRFKLKKWREVINSI